MGNHLYVAVPLMAVLAVIETSVLPRFPVLGVVPQILFLVALRFFGHGIAAAGLLDFPPLIMLHLILIVPIYFLLANVLRVIRPRRVEF